MPGQDFLPWYLREESSEREYEAVTPPGGPKGPSSWSEDDYEYPPGQRSPETTRCEPETILEQHQQIRDVVSPRPVKTITLTDAIRDASLERLRKLFLDIVRDNVAARAVATRHLLADFEVGQKLKMKRKAYEVCGNCGEDYAVGRENRLGVCMFHEGEKEVDEEYWAEQEPEIRGYPEEPELMNDPDSAEGYLWSCCEQTSDVKGCIVSRHVPKAVSTAAAGVKRRRV